MSNDVEDETKIGADYSGSTTRVLQASYGMEQYTPRTRWQRFIRWIREKTYPLRDRTGWFIGVEERLYVTLAEEIRKEVDKEVLAAIRESAKENN